MLFGENVLEIFSFIHIYLSATLIQQVEVLLLNCGLKFKKVICGTAHFDKTESQDSYLEYENTE